MCSKCMDWCVHRCESKSFTTIYFVQLQFSCVTTYTVEEIKQDEEIKEHVKDLVLNETNDPEEDSLYLYQQTMCETHYEREKYNYYNQNYRIVLGEETFTDCSLHLQNNDKYEKQFGSFPKQTVVDKFNFINKVFSEKELQEMRQLNPSSPYFTKKIEYEKFVNFCKF